MAKGSEFSRIFVGNLPESTTDSGLRELFEQFGAVEAANLLPPKSNRRCGFVNYMLFGEAVDAMEAMHGHRLGAEVLSVILAQPREGGPFKSSRNSVAVRDDFENYKAAYLAAVDGGSSVEICDGLHRKIMASRPQKHSLSLRERDFDSEWRKPKQSSWQLQPSVGEREEDRDVGRLFVGGLPLEAGDEDLANLLDQLSVELTVPRHQRQVLECRVLPHKGCGYVRFATWEAAGQVMELLHERKVSGWHNLLRVHWATPKQERQAGGDSHHLTSVPSDAGGRIDRDRGAEPAYHEDLGDEDSIKQQGMDPRRLFVGQLCRDMTDKGRLHSLFGEFGHIENIRHLEDKGVAYVQFSSFGAASAAKASLSAKVISGISRREGLNITYSKCR